MRNGKMEMGNRNIIEAKNKNGKTWHENKYTLWKNKSNGKKEVMHYVPRKNQFVAIKKK